MTSSRAPVEFQFTLDDGRQVKGMADEFTMGDASVGLPGPYYESTWAENENGQQIQLTNAEDDRLFEAACKIAYEGDWP